MGSGAVRRTCISLLAGAGALLCAASSPAGLLLPDYADLEMAVRDRTPTSPEEERALERAVDLLNGPDLKFSDHLRDAIALRRILMQSFPGDPEFEELWAAAVEEFRKVVGWRRDSLEALADALDGLPGGPGVARALHRTEEALSAAEDATDDFTVVRRLMAAQKSTERGTRSAGVGDGTWLVAMVNGRRFTSRLSMGGGFSKEGTFSVSSWSGRNWLDVARGNFRIITLDLVATGVGTFPLGGESTGVYSHNSYWCSGRYGCADYSTEFGGSGTVHITRADADGFIEGDFEFTTPADPPWPKVEVTSGRFWISEGSL